MRLHRDSHPPPWSIGVLLLAWVLPGLLGHDPWKPDEAYSMGLIQHILESGQWLVPTLGGEPFMEKPPLYYVTAAYVADALAPLLPLHDGARLTSGLYMTIVLLCVALTGNELYGKGQGSISLLLMMGSIGLLPHAHQMITDTALLAGFAMALYGLALSRRRCVLGGVLLGLGTALGFMTKGLLAPFILGGVVILMLLFSTWRQPSFVLSLLIALLTALPGLTVWPALLYQQVPDLFDVWFWENNYGRFFGSSVLATQQEPGHYLKALLWFTGPALPLALFGLWRERRHGPLGAHRLLPLLMAVVVLATLLASSATRTLYLLPLLPPIALLATPMVWTSPAPPRWLCNVVILFFTLLAILVWWIWLAALHVGLPGEQGLLLHLSRVFVIPEQLSFQGLPFALAVLASGAWMLGVRHLGRSAGYLIMGWSGGVTWIWLLVMTLWLPVINYGKSYRSMVADLQQALAGQEGCIASRGLGEPQRAMLHYYGQIFTQRVENRQAKPGCPLLLIQSPTATPHDPPSRETLLWSGGRPGDEKEWYFLYRIERR
ncbi:MAG: glycosyltransferase family 39 protein [Magnetococcales bacterium]|nr:glycosyltransferase family 39 protein [Magnetococcales bacterium]